MRYAIALLALCAGLLPAYSGPLDVRYYLQSAPYYAPRPPAAIPAEPPQRPQRTYTLQRTVVDYPGVAAGNIVIDTAAHWLYFGLGDGKAVRYGIGVGRDGMRWSGTVHVQLKREWPDWIPPQAMLARQPYLPRYMAGGEGNPLGARALYLYQGASDSQYRIHGTNDPKSIGLNMSSGCIRLMNEDIIDLYQRVAIGAQVTVLK